MIIDTNLICVCVHLRAKSYARGLGTQLDYAVKLPIKLF